MAKRHNEERKEILWRILVGIVTGVILSVWKFLIFAVVIFHAIKVLITDKRDKDLYLFCEYWNTEVYRYLQYMTFGTNEQPFPFTPLRRVGKFHK